jgi:hypothetical protein
MEEKLEYLDALSDLVGGFAEELREWTKDHEDMDVSKDIGFLLEDAEDALDSILTARDNVLDAEGEAEWMADQEESR